jgi:ATP-dependent DNA ligase
MPLRRLSRSIEPCLPRPAKEPPTGDDWLHEIKHDGFRILARRDARGIRLYTRNGYNFADRFPRIVEAIESLPVQSCFIDGEAIVVDENGLSVFDLIRYRQHDSAAVLCAFDLIELDGEDLRQKPIEERKHTLANVLFRECDGIAFNRHYDCDGAIIFKHACALGCEGIVSKRVGSSYRSGRVNYWLKIKNPAAPAVKREAEEDWGRYTKV